MTTWLVTRDGNFHKKKNRPTAKMPERRDNLDAEPCPTVTAEGIGGAFRHKHHIEGDGMTKVPKERKTKRGKQLFDAEHAKPPYRVPTMAEIARVRWNGLTVATTFAGCGGSSLGYRMAGFRVAWANEFVPIAAECYRLNARRGTVVDTRDVREIKAEDILRATGLKRGELDLLDGSPPCQAFSTAGKREKGWGTEREYEHGARQRNEDLFFEFARLLDGLRPRAFVAENVSGLVKGVAKGYFLEILRRLKACGYRVEARVLDAQWLGVPQQRQRLIYVGAREDLGLAPAFPAPLPHRYSVRDALPWIGRATHDTGGKGNWGGSREFADRPAPTITNGGHPGSNVMHYKVEDAPEVRLITAGNERHTAAGRRPTWNADTEPSPTIMATVPGASVVMRSKFGKNRREVDVTDQPALSIRASGGKRATEDVCVVGNSNAAHSRKGERRSADEPARAVMSRRVNLEVEIKTGHGGGRRAREEGKSNSLDRPMPAVLAGGGKSKPQFVVEQRVVHDQGGKFNSGGDVTDRPAPTVLGPRNVGHFTVERVVHRTHGQHLSQGDVSDRPAPTVAARRPASFAVEKGADISGYAIGAEYDRLNPGQQSEKFFNLVRADAGKPSPCVTAEGGQNAGIACVTHPTEKRKFTIAELKRICAYPDDFQLVGSYAQQWERLGNSVPPLMMRAIAEAVRDGVLLPARAAGRRRARRRGRAKARAASRPGSAAAATRA